jgi:hypothetical protein
MTLSDGSIRSSGKRGATESVAAVTLQPNPPKDHHFIPEFFIRSWCGEDGRVARFNEPTAGKLVARRVFPSQVGFREHLYTNPFESDPWKAAEVETKIMAAIDDAAAKQLDRLLSSKRLSWDGTSRTAWTTFLLSLMHRTPQSMRATISQVAKIWDKTTPEIQKKYELTLKQEGYPERAEDYLLSLDPLVKDKAAFSAFSRSSFNSEIGQFVNNLIWGVVDVSKSDHELILSDAALIWTPLKNQADTLHCRSGRGRCLWRSTTAA